MAASTFADEWEDAAPRVVRIYRKRERLIIGIFSVIVVLGIWELAARFGLIREIATSSPTGVAVAGWRELSNPTLWANIGATLGVWALGVLSACVVGVALGLIAGWFIRVGYIANPWLNVLDAIPHLALVPMFILWFGVGIVFKVFLVFLGSLFFVAVNTMMGVKAVEGRYIDVATTFRAPRGLLFRTVILPGSVPYIMTGLRQAVARGFVAVISAELISANVGIGFMLSIAGATLNTPRLMFGIVLLAAFGIVVNELVRRLEERFDGWRS
jgi:ABC-type nitrate/sulfonate/bicarbonate transport system permease component